jgi:hypothetical protein
LAGEQIVEATAIPIEPEVPLIALVTPKKIEWVMPDDDIPLLEDVQEALAIEQAAGCCSIGIGRNGNAAVDSGSR